MAIPECVQCVQCGHQQPFQLLAPLSCQSCGATWLEPQYDYGAFKREVLSGLRGHSYDIWRYHSVLPVDEPSTLDFKNVGWTPLQQARLFGPQAELFLYRTGAGWTARDALGLPTRRASSP